jgi:hypothetical protein
VTPLTKLCLAVFLICAAAKWEEERRVNNWVEFLRAMILSIATGAFWTVVVWLLMAAAVGAYRGGWL